MHTVIKSIMGVFGKSLRDASNLASVLVAGGTLGALVFFLSGMIGTAPGVIPASRLNSLAADRAVQEWDEAVFATTWAQLRATPHPAVTLVARRECDEGCLSLLWPDGTAYKVDLTTALDFAALCGCPMVVQSR